MIKVRKQTADFHKQAVLIKAFANEQMLVRVNTKHDKRCKGTIKIAHTQGFGHFFAK